MHTLSIILYDFDFVLEITDLKLNPKSVKTSIRLCIRDQHTFAFSVKQE